ncbi:MAG: hypothetical protein M1838_005531 [Thelocarpon superellum]|nr:MAG: hypothetical protein M1838_005531 [Thelocarpon superellum]
MSDEPRRSGRATKGQHTKPLETSADASKPMKPKSAKSKNTPDDEDDEEENDAIIRCICGTTTEEEDEDEERMMICCDRCACWQHNECMEVSQDEDALPETYLCELCSPEDHRTLLEKVGRGEKPWEERAKQPKPGKKGKKATTKGRGGQRGPGDAKPEVVENLQGQVGKEQANHGDDANKDGLTSHAPGSDLSNAMGLPAGRRASGGKRKLRGNGDAGTPEAQPVPSAKVRKISGPDVKGPKADGNGLTSPSAGDAPPSGLESIPNLTRRKTAGVLIKAIGEQIASAQANGSYTLPDEKTLEDVALQLGLEVEKAVFSHHSNHPGEPSTEYRVRLRSMMFNLKKNPALRDRLLHQLLSPDEFSTMSTDAMASEELQKRTAEMRKETEKQHILIKDDGPRIRRTHKGEELVGDEREHGGGNESIFAIAPARRRETTVEPQSPSLASPMGGAMSPDGSDVKASPGREGSPDPARSATKSETKASPHVGGGERRRTSAFNIQDVWSTVQSASAGTEAKEPGSFDAPSETAVSIRARRDAPEVAIDSEIDQLLNDDVESPPYSPTDNEPDESVIWRGKVAMEGQAEFSGTARHVGGADLSASVSWPTLIPSVINVDGRISVDRASNYLCGLRYSKSTDVVVVSVSAVGGEAAQQSFAKLWDYFHARNKYGVAGSSSLPPTVKDAYIIPVEAGIEKLPEFMEMLAYMSIESPRTERMLLVTFVVRAGTTTPSASAVATPQQPDATALSTVTPINPTQWINPPATTWPQTTPAPTKASTPNEQHAAPTNPATNPSLSTSTPLPFSARAASILGALAHTRVAKEVLSQSTPQLGSATAGPPQGQGQGQGLSDKQLHVIRDILERVPAAREDFALFARFLSDASAREGAGAS